MRTTVTDNMAATDTVGNFQFGNVTAPIQGDPKIGIIFVRLNFTKY